MSMMGLMDRVMIVTGGARLGHRPRHRHTASWRRARASRLVDAIDGDGRLGRGGSSAPTCSPHRRRLLRGGCPFFAAAAEHFGRRRCTTTPGSRAAGPLADFETDDKASAGQLLRHRFHLREIAAHGPASRPLRRRSSTPHRHGLHEVPNSAPTGPPGSGDHRSRAAALKTRRGRPRQRGRPGPVDAALRTALTRASRHRVHRIPIGRIGTADGRRPGGLPAVRRGAVRHRRRVPHRRR